MAVGVHESKEAVDLELVWWLVQLGLEDRETYRRVRALAWELVQQNHTADSESSDTPNKRS
jgi:hypothetical protein